MQRKLLLILYFIVIIALLLGLSGLLANNYTLNGLLNSSLLEVAPIISIDTNAVKLSIMNNGIYQVKLNNLGWEGVDPNNLLLTHRGQPQSIWFFRENTDNSVFFYGQPSDSIYTKENTYILEITDDLNPLVEATTPKSSDYFIEQINTTLRLEENLFYAPLVKTGDHWFWNKLLAPQTQIIEFELTDLVPGNGNIQVELWGKTTAFFANPDHHVIIRVNGTLVSDSYWNGQTRHTVDVPIPDGVLHNGKNTIEIELPGDTDSKVEIVNLDWIEIDYTKSADLSDGLLFFTTGEDAVQFSNLGSKAFIVDITEPQNLSVSKINESSPVFQGEESHRYIAVSSDGYYHPNEIIPVSIKPDLVQLPQGAEYIIISPEEFLDSVEPLLECRKSQGLSAKSIPINAIYDQFNYGLAEPEAIQQFLAYSVENWKPAPKYVLLVGDTTYDFKGFTDTKNRNILPSMVVYTSYGGETVSDILIAQINDDPWPDIAIGRIPAQTKEQVDIFVEKILHYEQQTYDNLWQQNILAVADGQEPRFQMDAQTFINLFPSEYSSTIFAPPAGGESTNEEILNLFNNGSYITAYFGHGSVNMWGKDRIFSIDDVSNLTNLDRLPIMLHMTCLTGLFTHPSQESLMESLLWNENGGAVAILAPTSLTLPGPQGYLTNAFVEELLRSPESRLGDIALYAWRQISTESTSSLDVMNTFLLFGDPALQLPSPPK